MTTRFVEPFGLGIEPREMIAAARGSLKAISRWWSYHKTVRELSRLDSHMLKDLGIQRSEIPWIAREATRSNHRPHCSKTRNA